MRTSSQIKSNQDTSSQIKTHQVKSRHILTVVAALFLMAFITATSNVSSENDKANLTDEKETTFTLSGTVTSNDHPELSWNSVSGADQYRLLRLPVPSFGIGKVDSFSLDADIFTFTDSELKEQF
jgi:hypothetical protein